MEISDVRERESLLASDGPPSRDVEPVSLEVDGASEAPEGEDPNANGSGSTDPLEQNKDRLNALFGFRPFSYNVAKKPKVVIEESDGKDYDGTIRSGHTLLRHSVLAIISCSFYSIWHTKIIPFPIPRVGVGRGEYGSTESCFDLSWPSFLGVAWAAAQSAFPSP